MYLLYVGLRRKAFPGKQANIDTGQCFCVVAQATPQDSPKASPRAIFKWKNLIGQLSLLLEWMLNESWRRLSSTCQRVATLQFDSCAEKDSHIILDQCHGVRSQEHKLLPGLTLAQKNCCTVYSLNLIHDHEFASTYIYIRVFNLPAWCRFA